LGTKVILILTKFKRKLIKLYH